MPQLNKSFVLSLAPKNNFETPVDGVWNLPEKVLQFGTGVLLRGLPDYYINKANNEGVFNGRIVVVKSTGSGSIDGYAQQDALYTHCIKGLVNGVAYEKNVINAAISRIINANSDWPAILACASNPSMQIIVSNTTEVGISLLATDNVNAAPPQSFPGKLLAFLYARYLAFSGSEKSGMVIIPTELLVNNGGKLKEIVLTLAQINNMESNIINWLATANDWCNSLVDRIVPGALPPHDKKELETAHDYYDELAIMSEPYNLWAIETSHPQTRLRLSFAEVNKGVVITPDIHKYRELKLRLLNATHTFSCGLAFLYRFGTVHRAMSDDIFHRFISGLLFDEMVSCVTEKSISEDEAKAFATDVLNRFSNPFIQHQWLSITVQYTGKMKLRCVPLIVKHYQQSQQPPTGMAIGFAAFLAFMKPVRCEGDIYFGKSGGEDYQIKDEAAKKWYLLWRENNETDVVKKALRDIDFWGEDLCRLPHFESEVARYVTMILSGKDLSALTTAAE